MASLSIEKMKPNDNFESKLGRNRNPQITTAGCYRPHFRPFVNQKFTWLPVRKGKKIPVSPDTS